MQTEDLNAAFGPPAGDRSLLSKSNKVALDAIFRHPIAHSLEWSDVVTLFEKLGSVERKSNNEMVFSLGAEHHRVPRPHAKELSADEVMVFRSFLTRAGWSPHQKPAHEEIAPGEGASPGPDLLLAVDHHEARLYRLDFGASAQAEPTIRPYDPHHFLHHLAHKDQPRERGQRSPEDPSFYRRIAEALVTGGRIVVIGHGEGHSNAAHHLIAYLHEHHPAIAQRLACEVVADLSHLTSPQLLDLGRRALSQGADNGAGQGAAE